MSKKISLFSPLGIFFIYTLAGGLAIMLFRFILPGEAAPLPHFSLSWRLIRGLLDYLALFPALALSALIIPFGFKVQPKETIDPFSPRFLQSLKMSIVTAIVAAALYGLLFSLALPLARDYEANLRFQGQVFRLAREQAQEHAFRGQWAEAAQFLAINERIWPGSYQIARLAGEVENRLEERRGAAEPLFDTTAEIEPPSLVPRPPGVTEALSMADTALAEERFFDAHWLATLALRLARPDSPEAAAARRLASMAWNGVNSLQPSVQETRAFNIFRLKLEGYQALTAEEWIRAYYIFLELLELSPADPDAHRFFAMSEVGLRQVAFFIDEMDRSLGQIQTGAVFSLPLGLGRLVARFRSLSVSSDSAYGMGVEILSFDRDGRLLWSMEAPYAKILPLALDRGPGIAVLLRALDRLDQSQRWEPVTRSFGQSAPDTAQISLSISWNDFVLLSNVRRGVPVLSVADLQTAAENLRPYGYKPEVFQVELIRRFAEPLLLLLMGILAITVGWRLRALGVPRFMGILMLGLMPAVFFTAVNFCRGWVNNLGILAVLSLGFTTAAFLFAAVAAVLFILLLILLAAQHG